MKMWLLLLLVWDTMKAFASITLCLYCAVGYGTGTSDSEASTNYYKVKNSWGASWGEKGFIRMERGTKAGTRGMCGILSGPPSYPVL